MRTVLIVEDEKMIRQGIRNMIQRSGVEVEVMIECNNGEAALEILQEQQVDVMFTDIRMPKMDGIELVSRAQELDHIPLIVVISGYDDFSYAVEMMRHGVKEYILKPVDREQITAIMHKLEDLVQENKKEEEARKQIGLQQLRFLCSINDIKDIEKKLIEEQYKKFFFDEEYLVCCCSCELEGEERNSQSIYLGTVENTQVFIVVATNKGYLLKNELRHCNVGFSKATVGIENLQQAYREAYMMRKKAFAFSIPVCDYDEAQNITLENEELTDNIKTQIVVAVNKMGTEHVQETVDYIDMLARQVIDKQLAIGEFEKEIGLFITEAAKNYEKLLKVSQEDILELQYIYRYQDIKEYVQTLKDWIYKFHDLISEEFDDYKNRQKIQQAIAYIHENYHKDLNMAVVSNEISMNYSLFSYTFKQYTGKNFVAYLKEIRIEKAKQLLIETDKRVIEISQEVGYENEKHFMKSFKALCGISPTEYRKNRLS